MKNNIKVSDLIKTLQEFREDDEVFLSFNKNLKTIDLLLDNEKDDIYLIMQTKIEEINNRAKTCGECTDKLCCGYKALFECFGKIRADSFLCIMKNENNGKGMI